MISSGPLLGACAVLTGIIAAACESAPAWSLVYDEEASYRGARPLARYVSPDGDRLVLTCTRGSTRNTLHVYLEPADSSPLEPRRVLVRWGIDGRPFGGNWSLTLGPLEETNEQPWLPSYPQGRMPAAFVGALDDAERFVSVTLSGEAFERRLAVGVRGVDEALRHAREACWVPCEGDGRC